MSTDSLSSPITLGNLSLQPCIDKLSKAVLDDKNRVEEFTSAENLQQQVHVLLKTFSHKPNVTIREAVFEIVKELSQYGDSEEGKLEELAEKCKTEGSKAFGKHQNELALRLYTKALQLCPQSSPSFPLLYANRSAVLFHMTHHQECLTDIRRAEQSGYPTRLRHKLATRKAQCLLQLGQLTEAREAMQEAQQLTADLTDTRQRQNYSATLESVTQAMERLATRNDTSTDSSNANVFKTEIATVDINTFNAPTDIYEENTAEKEDFLNMANRYNLFDGPHERINYISAALEQKATTTEGRHITTKRAIPSGSTVFVERPFATILLPKYHSTYCYNCITMLSKIPIPCLSCRVVLFCNEVCRSAGMTWHKLDCCRLTLTSAGGMAQLALRAVMVAGWSVCDTVKREDNHNSKVYNSCSRVDRYRAVYNLVHHLDTMPPDEQIQYCLAAIILASGLQNKVCAEAKPSQCSSSLPDGWGSLEEVAAVVYKHIAQLVCNGYAIYQVISPPLPSAPSDEPSSNVESLSQERLASAIYSTASLMNHSCKPTTINSYVGNLLVIRTVQDLRAGDQVYSCYGPHYCRQARADRLSLLDQQYQFTCQCEPCTQPQYLHSELRWSGFKCESCAGVASFDEDQDLLTCHECGVIVAPSQRFRDSCTKAQELQSLGVSGMKGGWLDQSVRDLREAVRLGEQVYCIDNQCLAAIHDAFAMVLAASGQHSKSLDA